MHNAIKWLEGMEGELWLYEAKTLGSEDVMAIDILLKPFIEVAKHNREFANFFLMLIEKWDEKYEGVKGITARELLRGIRDELATIVASFPPSASNEDSAYCAPV